MILLTLLLGLGRAQDKELQGTLVQRLQSKVENMQRIALKVQNALDGIASALERVRGVVCWADPTATAFTLLVATAAALAIAALGLHTLLSVLLCWLVSSLCCLLLCLNDQLPAFQSYLHSADGVSVCKGTASCALTHAESCSACAARWNK
jgi:hypothetical protein